MTLIEIYATKFDPERIPVSDLSPNSPVFDSVHSSNHLLETHRDILVFTRFHPDTNNPIGKSTRTLSRTPFTIVTLVENDHEAYAAKLVRPKQAYQSQVVVERDIFLKLGKHPNIVKYKGLATAIFNGVECPVLLTEYIPNSVTLDTFFSTPQPEHIIPLLKQSASALIHMHKRRIVHADISPKNILVSKHKGNPLATIIDLSLSEDIPEDQSFFINQKKIGTQDYAPPEQSRQMMYGFKNDVFSFAAVWFEILRKEDGQNMLYKLLDFQNDQSFTIKEEYKHLFHEQKLFEAFSNALQRDYEVRTDSVKQFLSEVLKALK
jgi:serine/threonine protein kinase